MYVALGGKRLIGVCAGGERVLGRRDRRDRAYRAARRAALKFIEKKKPPKTFFRVVSVVLVAGVEHDWLSQGGAYAAVRRTTVAVRPAPDLLRRGLRPLALFSTELLSESAFFLGEEQRFFFFEEAEKKNKNKNNNNNNNNNKKKK